MSLIIYGINLARVKPPKSRNGVKRVGCEKNQGECKCKYSDCQRFKQTRHLAVGWLKNISIIERNEV